MIYGRFGNEVAIVRTGTLADVKELDKREPDAADRENVAVGGYVVTRSLDPEDKSDKLRLHHLAFMRADGGLKEIMAAVAIADAAAGIDAAVDKALD